ncbi:MAG: APC family permease [Bryobacterales bacterium]|nr:APC family permease [Bryobacterales bacterium]
MTIDRKECDFDRERVPWGMQRLPPQVHGGGGAKLRRVLSRGDLVIYGLTIITPTAAYPVFGIVQEVSRGHAALAYLVAVVAMLFTAASYGHMAAAFPSAGSTYTYARRALHDYVGFLAGWSMMLDYVLVPLLSGVYVSITATRLVPSVPYAVWAFLFAATITMVNVRGIRVTARTSKWMMLAMTVSAVLFVALAIRWALLAMGWGGLLQPDLVLNLETFELPPLMTAAAIGTLSYLGFDAVSTLAEDTKNPEKDIGFATLTVCVLQAGFCFLITYLAAVVWSPAKPFPNVETAILDVASIIGGTGMFGFTTFILLLAAVASSVTSQAGASRLLFGMGRDGILPKRIFAYIDPVHATPTRSIYLMGIISFLGALVISFQLIVELVNFGAFVGFILVNLSVVRHYYLQEKRRGFRALFRYLIFPSLGAIVCAYVWSSLGVNSKILGFGWLTLGLIYLAVMTRGFRLPMKDIEIV